MTLPARYLPKLLGGTALAVSCLLMMTFSAYADTVEGLYESRQKVSGGQQELSQSQLIRDAYTHVLIKVTGMQNITQHPEYHTLLPNAEKAVQLFRYETEEQQEAPAEKWFWVRFNERSINRQLSKNYLPVWGDVRPTTLLWFTQEIDGRRVMQSQHDAPDLYAVMEQQAEYRGIELIFPFMDLQDQSNISEADIWGNFNEPVLAASRRYQSQSTLTLSLYQERGGLWVANWTYLILGETHQWKTQAEQLAQALGSGIDRLADQLARKYALVADDRTGNTLIIQVNNVASYNQYQRLGDYFATLASIKKAALLKIEQDRSIYKIFYQGDQSALLREIDSGDVLQQIEMTRQFSNEADTGRDFKPVILDDVQKTSTTSSNGSALGAAAGQQTVIEKPVERLTPEFEYWLAR